MSNIAESISKSPITQGQAPWRKWWTGIPLIIAVPLLLYFWVLEPTLQPCGWLTRILRLSECTQVLDAHTDMQDGYVTNVAFSSNGEIFAASSSYVTTSSDGLQYRGGVRLWRVFSSAYTPEMERTTAPLQSMALSSDGTTLATGTDYGLVQLWQSPWSRPLDISVEHPGPVRSIAFSPDGTMIASTSLREVWLWNRVDGSLLYTFAEDYPIEPRSLVFSPDGEILAASCGETWLWKVDDGTLVRIIGDGIGPIAFSPDGKLLASDIGFEVELRRVSDGALIHTLDGPGNALHSLAFSPDGEALIAASGSLLYLWRVSDGTLLRTVETQHELHSVAVSSDGTLVVGTSDGLVLLWSLREN